MFVAFIRKVSSSNMFMVHRLKRTENQVISNHGAGVTVNLSDKTNGTWDLVNMFYCILKTTSFN